VTVDKEVVVKAKNYARYTGRSLSKLIEAYLKNLIEEERDVRKISPKLKKLIGVVKLPKDFREKNRLLKE
jgi:hypothetical protein